MNCKYTKGVIVKTWIQSSYGFLPCFGTVVEVVDMSEWEHKSVPLYNILLPTNEVVTYPQGMLSKLEKI